MKPYTPVAYSSIGGDPRRKYADSFWQGPKVHRLHMASMPHLEDRCLYCGKKLDKPEPTDHLIPVTKGGITVVGNMVYCCTNCNSSKGNSLPFNYWNARNTAALSLHRKVRTPEAFLAALELIQAPFRELYPMEWALAQRLMTGDEDARLELNKKVIAKELSQPTWLDARERYGDKFITQTAEVQLSILNTATNEESALVKVLASTDIRLLEIQKLLQQVTIGELKKKNYAAHAVRMIATWDELIVKEEASNHWLTFIFNLAPKSRGSYTRIYKLIFLGLQSKESAKPAESMLEIENTQ